MKEIIPRQLLYFSLILLTLLWIPRLGVARKFHPFALNSFIKSTLCNALFKDSSDYKTLVDLDTLDVVEEAFCEGQSRFGCENEFVDVFQMLMEENSLTEPKNVIEAENLYFTLLTLLEGVV